jgi:EAL and modified HD-GYP domain-containing signal transduction protein
MIKAFFDWLFGSRRPSAATPPVEAPAHRGFETLNRDAPLREDASATSQAATQANTFLCREAVLGRDQRIAGYHFMLQ